MAPDPSGPEKEKIQVILLRRKTLLRHLCIIILALTFFASGSVLAGSSYGEQRLLLFYSNDVLGETEPCG
jgi:hypothetical protein